MTVNENIFNRNINSITNTVLLETCTFHFVVGIDEHFFVHLLQSRVYGFMCYVLVGELKIDSDYVYIIPGI